jgi:hypothetical protein
MKGRAGLKLLARSGYAARGVVYLVVGSFAVLAALTSTHVVGTRDALRTILGQPFGVVLLWIVVAGLFAYASWRLVQAIGDPDSHGTSWKGLGVRAGLVGSAVAHILLALFAMGLLVTGVHAPGEGGGSGQAAGSGNGFLAALLGFEESNLVIYAIAVVPLIVGIAHILKGWRARFERHFQAGERVMCWVRPISRVGLIARGVAFIIVAALLFLGGARYEPTNPPGIEDALEALRDLPYGWVALLGVAVGLLAFSVYSFAEAVWRRINIEEAVP